MDSTTLTRFTVLLLAVAVAGIAFPATGDAKVSCEGRVELSRVDLVGLPADPESHHTYAVTVDLPRKHAVNPRALLMGVRCDSDGPGSFGGSPPGAGSVQFPGTPAGPATSTFQVRFPSGGRWRLASMDVSGTFRDHGYFTVRSPGSSSVAAGGGAAPPLVVAAAIMVPAALAFGLLRRLRQTRAI